MGNNLKAREAVIDGEIVCLDVQIGKTYAPSGATVFPGQTISISPNSHATLSLSDRSSVELREGASLRCEADRLTLSMGRARATLRGKTALLAGTLRLIPESGSVLIDATMRERGRVNVVSWSGNTRAIDPTGKLLAVVRPGKPLLFGLMQIERPIDQQAGGKAPGVDAEGREEAGGTAPGDNRSRRKKAADAGAAGGAAAGGAAAGAAGGAAAGGAVAAGAATATYVVVGVGAAAAAGTGIALSTKRGS